MTLLPMLYLLSMVFLLVVALRLMWFNVSQINKMLNNPVEVNPRLQHPELDGVKNGDELMVVIDIQFTPDEGFSDLFLSKSLNKRLDELDEDEDEDDDDGDIVVRV